MSTTFKQTVTQEQIDACSRFTHENTGEVFYLVQSATTPGQYYRVIWNKQYHRLQCTCKAAQEGNMCWHRRAALLAAEQYREEKRAERIAQERVAFAQRSSEEIAEQSQIEEYVRQGIDRETATRVVYAKGTQRTEQEIKQAQYLNQPNEFRFLK